MTELKLRIHDESNGLDYVLVGDYYLYVWQTAQDIFRAVPPCKVLCPLFIRRTAYLPC